MLKPWLFVGLGELVVGTAAQAQIIPDNLINIFVQLPLVAVIIWLQLQNQKWLEHMLEVQRNSIKEIYAGQQAFLLALLNQIEAKQNKMSDQITGVEKQLNIFGAMLAEVASMDDLVERLMERLRK